MNIRTITLFAGILSLTSAYAQADDSLEDALLNGKLLLNLRYRYEHDDQNGLKNDANASTLRTRIGYETGYFDHIKGVFEMENVSNIGPTDFNNTINNRTNFPRVNDPSATDINQLYLETNIIPQTDVTVGRQRMTFDNSRFVGAAGWRQNDPTFDALRIVNTSIPDVQAIYSYSDNVFRNLGDKDPLNNYGAHINLAHLAYTGIPDITLATYGYFVGLDNAATLSSKTFGVRGEGRYPLPDDFKLTYLAEYARQSDYDNNPDSFDLGYYRIEPGVGWKGLHASIGDEVLEGNGKDAVQTPLSSNHPFNGWANKFSTTPPDGLDDKFVTAGYTTASTIQYFGNVQISSAWHDFTAYVGDSHYGNEGDISISKTFDKRTTVSLEYNDYLANSFGTNTQKIYMMVNYLY